MGSSDGGRGGDAVEMPGTTISGGGTDGMASSATIGDRSAASLDDIHSSMCWVGV